MSGDLKIENILSYMYLFISIISVNILKFCKWIWFIIL